MIAHISAPNGICRTTMYKELRINSAGKSAGGKALYAREDAMRNAIFNGGIKSPSSFVAGVLNVSSQMMGKTTR